MPVPIPSSPLGLCIIGCPFPKVKVEIFQDFACPYSARLWKTLSQENGVFDKVRANDELKSKIEFVMYNVPQPWHPQSPCMHEAYFAVQCAVKDEPTAVQKYLKAAFSAQGKLADYHAKDLSRVQIHEFCATIAEEAFEGTAKKEDVMKYLDFSHLSEANNNAGLGEVTKRLKFHIKHHRKRGVHVTPTVFVNDIENPGIESSFTVDEWMKMLTS